VCSHAAAVAHWKSYSCGLSGGGTEPQPGSVGQPRHSLGPKHRRQPLKHVGHPLGRDDGDPSACSMPQGTGAPWTATMAATWTSATPRTSSAWFGLPQHLA
jgi:hypothetical protein